MTRAFGDRDVQRQGRSATGTLSDRDVRQQERSEAGTLGGRGAQRPEQQGEASSVEGPAALDTSGVAGVEVETLHRGSEQGALHLAAALKRRGVRRECRRTQPEPRAVLFDHVCDPF